MKKIVFLITSISFLLVSSQGWSLDPGSAECGIAQQTAQQAAVAGQPYKNHGQMVRTAAQALIPFLSKGVISEECNSCILSQFSRGIPVSEQQSCGPAENWAITFTNEGTALPDTAIDFICSSVKSEVILWLERQATAYQQQLPFSGISCFKGQISITEDLLGECPLCLNEPAVITFLENSLVGLKDAKFATVVHYLDNPDSPFIDNAYNAIYDFYFFRVWQDPAFPFYPILDVNSQGETMIHELLHKLGASDKYYDGPEQACAIDPATGQQYSGYDIMCHRVPDPAGEGYIFPPLSELIITEPTAKEIGWR